MFDTKNILLLPCLIVLVGCLHSSVEQNNVVNKSHNEVIENELPIDTDIGVSLDKNPAIEQITRNADQVPPYSVEALLDKEISGSDFTIGRVLDENVVYTRHYITYVSDGLTISGIMNVPKATATDPGPWPVLFLNHGYIDPRIYTNGRGLKREQDYFARNGYVVIHSDYRDHADSDTNPIPRDKVGESGYGNDIIGGIAAFKSLNPDFAHVNQIGMLGHSMGGGVTMRVAVARPEIVQAAVLYAPVSSDYLDNLSRWGLDRIAQSEVVKLRDDEGRWDKEKISPYSPQTFFDRATTPFMIHHGDRDKDVPIQWSKDTLNRLMDADKEVIYHEYPGEGHEFGPAWTTFMQRNVAFFDKHLKN